MSIPILQTCRKRKRFPKLYSLNTFCDPGCPIEPTGAFRDNVRVFLQECAEVEDYNVDSMPVWCTLLVLEKRGVVIPLYTIEENVALSEQPFCDHCRCTGWSHHYMSRRKYHIIIPLDTQWNKPLSSDVFEDQTHLLHGLIHCNGFGHLLCINGIEGGSKYLRGREIMDLWHRICTNLHVREITVEDTSRKRSMDLRLLHGIAYGHPWFGKWGYKFCHGSFGVQAHHYQGAVETLSSLNLDDLVDDLPESKADIKQIISFYRETSKTRLTTLRDLLRFMLTLKLQPHAINKNAVAEATVHVCSTPTPTVSTKPALRTKRIFAKSKPTKCRKFASVIATMDSRWPTRRLEYTAEVIVNALKEKREVSKSTNGGMTRQEVRDAARAHIGDTGLLDYVLKSMNHVLVGNNIVRRQVNPVNRVLEYTIHDADEPSSMVPEKKIASSVKTVSPPAAARTSFTDKKPARELHVYAELQYLYEKVLLDMPASDISGLSVRVILDSKHFVRKWPFKDENDQLLRFICQVRPTTYELDTELSKELSPGEIIVLPLHASFGDLKVAAQHALRDTYCIMEKYVVSDIESLDSSYDDEVLFGAINSGSELWVRGSGIDLTTDFRYEGGPDNWTVKCTCGAKDDDGERMVSCDICEVWQHTSCSGIEDSDVVPPLFVCRSCCSTLMPPRVETLPDFDTFPNAHLFSSGYSSCVSCV